PSLAIAQAQLSIAYTELNAPAAARDALAQAVLAAPRASAHDRRHIELRALQMAGEDAGQWPADKGAAFRAAVDRANAEFPKDAELWLLRGLAESSDAAERGQGSGAAAIPFFERARTLGPDAFAAHHYLTHAYENTGRAAEALAEGGIYAKMA